MLKTSVCTEAKWIFVYVGLCGVLRVTVTGCPTRTSVVGTLVQVFIIRYSSLLIAIVPQFPRMTCLVQVLDAVAVPIVSSYVPDTVLLFPAVSVATPAATLTDTVPSEEPCTTSNVYVVPDPAKLLASGEPPFTVPVTVMSSIVKLLTDSLNVAVKLRVVSETVLSELPVDDVIVIVGFVVSCMNMMCTAPRLEPIPSSHIAPTTISLTPLPSRSPMFATP